MGEISIPALPTMNLEEGEAMESKRLLLADDDGVVLATFGKGLRDAGYEILETDSGEQAVQLALSEKPDLAILDVRMPGINGLDAARELKDLGVPVIFLSAYDDKEIVDTALAHGALGYLVKPIDVPRVIPTIEAAIQRAAELNELRCVKQRLSQALDTGAVVNVVIGLIMERQHMSREQAFEVLRKRARSERRKVRDVADELIQAWESVNRLTTAETDKTSRAANG